MDGAPVYIDERLPRPPAPKRFWPHLGPNGAGKTSTLESLEGLRAADGARLRVAGVDPTAEPGKLRRIIGVVTGRLVFDVAPGKEEEGRCLCKMAQARLTPATMWR